MVNFCWPRRYHASPSAVRLGRLRDHVALDKATSQNERDTVRARLADRRLRLAQRLRHYVGGEFVIGQFDAQPGARFAVFDRDRAALVCRSRPVCLPRTRQQSAVLFLSDDDAIKWRSQPGKEANVNADILGVRRGKVTNSYSV
jgi:hypothetical protein